MTGYRLYFLDHAGHIFSAEELKAEDDTAARALAELTAKPTRWELWDRARLVGRSEENQDRRGG